MRRLLSLIPFALVVVACAKTETPPADTAQAEAAIAPPAAPTISETDVAGTWKGTSTPMESDSVTSRWTTVCAAGSCKGTSETSKVTVEYTYTLAGDSSIGVSKPFSDPAVKGKQMIDTWVARVQGDNVSGTGWYKLASNPDSVVSRYRFSGTRSR